MSDHGANRRDLDVPLEQRRPRRLRPGPLGSLPAPVVHRWERVRQPRNDKLVEPLQLLEVGNLRRAEVAKRELARQVVLHEPRRRVREQDLAAVADVADPGRLVDREPHVPVLSDDRLARVQAHPNPHRVVVGPLLGSERPLRGRGRRGRRRGAREDGEERVALAVDLDPSALLECLAEQAVVRAQDGAVAVTAEGLEQPRRALDVREQEGDGAGGKLGCRFTQF